MKCPACGDEGNQERFTAGEQSSEGGYRCGRCGRLYIAPAPGAQQAGGEVAEPAVRLAEAKEANVRDIDVQEIVARLQEMKGKADALGEQRDRLIHQIAETEAQLRAAREQIDSIERRIRRGPPG